jgi:serine/threonine protein kinase
MTEECDVPEDLDGLDPEELLRAGLSPEETFPRKRLEKAFPSLEFLELLGRGGMGVVYKARQRSLDRTVAVKILPPEVADQPGFADRFSREAKAMAKLSGKSARRSLEVRHCLCAGPARLSAPVQRQPLLSLSSMKTPHST